MTVRALGGRAEPRRAFSKLCEAGFAAADCGEDQHAAQCVSILRSLQDWLDTAVGLGFLVVAPVPRRSL
jgi:hypothetical protein